MNNIIHIVYASFSTHNLSDIELEELLTTIREKNKQKGVTGLLLYNDASFIQVIEGTQEAIQQLFEIIKSDPRHTNIVKLLEESIEERAFPDWLMGFRDISNEKSSRIPGFSDFMISGNPDSLTKGITRDVLNLLNSFRQYT